MVITTSSKRFTVAQMEAGTDVDTWVGGLTITTLRAASTTALGTGWVMVTLVYE